MVVRCQSGAVVCILDFCNVASFCHGLSDTEWGFTGKNCFTFNSFYSKHRATTLDYLFFGATFGIMHLLGFHGLMECLCACVQVCGGILREIEEEWLLQRGAS